MPYEINKCRVLYFPNEKANEELINSDLYYDRLSEFGFLKDNIYVFNYFSPNRFDRNQDIDVIYISGGNTFGTLKRIRESGADEIIVDYIKKGVTYIGGSAGAHIATASVKHVAKYDTNTFGISDYSGLNLFDGILICHYTDERKADYDQLLSEGKKIVKLSNEDYIVVEK